ncbi:nitroreductase family deazaflavin-dependent oxidoreductase [Rhodococcus sp. G-MC3]|uniref:nitroreductase family deazaflavin-dependent oxidoreductase n=1 Tax=Rhodococcus sp. G-MC3 TaxID=3046209 RepID=UPI0024B89A4E|nr:nitroreductase family deazaflavin-dependent oxidoreductase [Rhodococcus sp. G-MC3]MDJ0392646.1 nitroreductase family deazaflavin-dependent oxidoreductase [Rhodococcus sp. G-MC3]
MQLPRRLALFNKYVNNRVQKSWAWLIPPWAIIIHQGRTSGREYRTPVLAWRSRGRIVVALHYGAHSDWVRNVMHHQSASIQRLGRTAVLVAPRIVDPATTDEFGPVLRLLVRPAEHALVADLSH